MTTENDPRGADTPGGQTSEETPPMATTQDTAAPVVAELAPSRATPPALAAAGIVYTPAGACIVHPQAGELMHVREAPTDALAAVIDAVKVHQGHVRDGRALLEAEVIGRLSEAGERGARAGAFMVEKGQRREWEHDATWAALGDLVEAGVISATEAAEAMPEIDPPPRKPDGRRLNALLTRLAGDVADNPEKLALVGALGQARSSRDFLKVDRCAVDSTAEDVA